MVNRVGVLGAISSALKANPELKALIGDRVFLIKSPSEDHEVLMPYVVLSQVSTSASNTSDLATGAVMILTINVWSVFSNGPANCMAISDAIDAVLNVWSNDSLGVIASTRQQSSNLIEIDGAWCDRLNYRFLINGG